MLGAVIQCFQQSFCFNKPACVYAKHCCSQRQLCVAEGDEMQLVLLNILYCQALCDKEHTKNWLAEQIFNQLQVLSFQVIAFEPFSKPQGMQAKIQLCSRACTHSANSRGQSQLQECQYCLWFPGFTAAQQICMQRLGAGPDHPNATHTGTHAHLHILQWV